MKKIAVYCVTYNTYEELQSFLSSVKTAAEAASDVALVSVFVADNTESDVQNITFASDAITLKVFGFHKNLGYFGAVKSMMLASAPELFDLTVISNVDLTLEKDTFAKIARQPVSQDLGWIAPCLFSRRLNYDRNPEMPHRYSRTKLEMLCLMFKYSLLMKLYRRLLYRKVVKRDIDHTPRNIYAGHGSFIILTRNYFQRCGKIDYPPFLFCEEIYLAENCRRNGLAVKYDPSIVIYDNEHASTSELAKKEIFYKYNYIAVKYILDKFY